SDDPMVESVYIESLLPPLQEAAPGGVEAIGAVDAEGRGPRPVHGGILPGAGEAMALRRVAQGILRGRAELVADLAPALILQPDLPEEIGAEAGDTAVAFDEAVDRLAHLVR